MVENSGAAARIGQRSAIRRQVYPEVDAGGFTRVDGSINFYARVNALLRPEMVVLDYGAGRGRWADDVSAPMRRELRAIKGKVSRYVGVDVDEAVLSNSTLDEAHVIAPGAAIPLSDSSVDLILCDYTFEHIDDPAAVSAELNRVLRPGGWLCARTPNRYGYIGLGSNLVPNALHVGLLARLQPVRKKHDVFPTRYALNTRTALKRYFPPTVYDHYVYTLTTEPHYAGSSRLLWRALATVNRHTPEALGAMLMIFLRKRH
jgi:SAM-dependent methyltransferase